MLMALAIVPAMALTGAAVDYSTSNKAKAKLDAVADSAALAAVDHTAISGTAAAAQTTAQNIFNSEAAHLANVTVSNVSVTVTDGTSGRTAVVTYTATKPNLFMGHRDNQIFPWLSCKTAQNAAQWHQWVATEL